MSLPSKHPIGVLALLTLLNILNFADRFLMQGFAVDLTADLHLSSLQFTLLTGFIFTTFYTFVGLFMGALADRVHRPRLMAAGIVVWSALTAATGVVGNFVQLGLARLFIGVGEATLTPAALGLLGDTYPPRRRAFAAGIYYLGAPIGIGGAFIIAGTLGSVLGWRNCFLALGVLGLLPALLLLLLREPRTARPRDAQAARRPMPGVLKEVRQCLAASPPLRLVMASGILVVFAQGALVLDQLWLVQERGLAKQQAQNLAGLMFLAGGVLGSVLGGWGADLMQARRAGGRLRFLAGVYLVGIPAGLAYRFVDPSGAAFHLYMFIGSVMVTIGYGPLFACLQDLVPDHVRSTMTAAMILGMTLFGTSAGNLLVGWLADTFRAGGIDEPITKAVLASTLPWILAIPCLLRAAHLAESGTPHEERPAKPALRA
ncbi:MAG: MFS transporter [Aquabacterium sp.]|nr:MAG: MFS transporter [Aquabacterium sp.]